MRLSGVLLAGGKSRRMGRDKAFLDFRGKELFRYPLGLLEKYCDEIYISSDNPRFQKLGFQTVADIYPGIGPLGGLYSGLKVIRNPRLLLLSCDIPMINSDYIDFLMTNCEESILCVGTGEKGRPEPLAGIYHRNLLTLIEEQIAANDYKMNHLLSAPGAKLVDYRGNTGNMNMLFLNINSPEDYRKLKELYESENR